MKLIFDRMRESIRLNSYDCCESNYSVDMVVDEDVAIRIVDEAEAEAKWESKVCEWSPMKFLEFSLSDCVTSCGHAEHYTVGVDKYCRHCGKPIKISEVE